VVATSSQTGKQNSVHLSSDEQQVMRNEWMNRMRHVGEPVWHKVHFREKREHL
jgi:hypothetical protein